MAHEPATQPKTMVLPVSVATPVDVGRVLRELAALDENLLQHNLRKQADEVKLPKTSHLLDQLVSLNKLNLLEEHDRVLLGQFLESVKAKAPVMHISFNADPSVAFIEKLMAWLRREIHPLILLTVGLQPNIGAGCIVRSTNHQFDFSLRQNFTKKRDLLIASLEPATAEAQP